MAKVALEVGLLQEIAEIKWKRNSQLSMLESRFILVVFFFPKKIPFF
jgi:hypothetical protein